MTFQEAIQAREWFTVTEMVMQHTTEPTTDEDGADELQDWLSNGSYTGSETPESVAAEWDALVRSTHDL